MLQCATGANRRPDNGFGRFNYRRWRRRSGEEQLGAQACRGARCLVMTKTGMLGCSGVAYQGHDVVAIGTETC
jgi:hypothetical protein